jgi:hypothetical protein
VLRPVLAAMIPYALVVLLATSQGYPGIVCVTPLAWGLGLWVGSQAFVISHNAGRTRPLLEAGIAGALCGLVQGILFAVVGPRMGGNPTQEEQMQSVVTGLCLLVPLGMLVTGGLAVASAARWQRLLMGGARPAGTTR